MDTVARQVLPEGVEEADAAAGILHVSGRAERAARGLPCLGLVHAGGALLPCLHREVEVQFVVQVSFGASREDECA